MLTEVLRRGFGAGVFSAQDAAEALGIRSPYSTLNRLKAAGILESVGRGMYRFTPDERPLRISAYLLRETMASTRLTRTEDLAELARKRWLDWQATGYITPSGPRRYRLNLDSETSPGKAGDGPAGTL